MDDSIGNWLYLIVIIVITVVSSLGSLKKKRTAETVTSPQPVSPTEFFPEPPPVRKSKKKQPPAPPQKSGYTPMFQDEGQRAVENIVSFPGDLTDDATPLKDLELDDAESFRKAIIYSEILNRKY